MVDDYSLVVDCGQLVSLGDTAAALELLRGAENHADLQHATLAVMAFVLSGNGAPERFAELRAQVHHLALQHGAQDRQVVLNLETIAATEALAEGDTDRADAILHGSESTALDFAWCAASLTGQCVRGWVGDDCLTPFWHGLRRHYGIGGAV
ncbi:hypothetical protein [Mycolicibacterium setense]|uniref:hypothetical protein n=1 Tax=Mycolicibacterium setense TaxID=431269 RepID=UPI00057523AA|nr:hypothetical protein [Mycolicibacterium setense]KHO21821.1 hypothetical protein QQ25_15100 [Mycolicibacterium setense]MCV7114010.1 hypothetical protein [Mycolicibacterium setense]